MHRSTLIRLLGTLLLAAALTACGDDDGGSSDTTAPPTDTTEQEDATAADDATDDAPVPSSGDESLWVVNSDTDEVFQVDPANGEVRTTIDTDAYPVDAAVGHGSVWVANAEGGTVTRIDPETAEIEETIDTEDARGVAIGEDVVWVSRVTEPSIVAIDPETNEVTQEIPLAEDEQDPDALVEVDDGTLVAVESYAAGLLQIDPDAGVSSELDTELITEILLEDGSLLAASSNGILAVDPGTLEISEEFPTEERPWAIAVDEDDPETVWVAFQTFPGTIQALDRSTGQLVGTPIELGDGQPLDIEVLDGVLWAFDENGELHRVDPETEEVETFTLPSSSFASADIAVG